MLTLRTRKALFHDFEQVCSFHDDEPCTPRAVLQATGGDSHADVLSFALLTSHLTLAAVSLKALVLAQEFDAVASSLATCSFPSKRREQMERMARMGGSLREVNSHPLLLLYPPDHIVRWL